MPRDRSASPDGQPSSPCRAHPPTSPSCSTVLILEMRSGETGAAAVPPPSLKNSAAPGQRQPSCRARMRAPPATSPTSRPTITKASATGSDPCLVLRRQDEAQDVQRRRRCPRHRDWVASIEHHHGPPTAPHTAHRFREGDGDRADEDLVRDGIQVGPQNRLLVQLAGCQAVQPVGGRGHRQGRRRKVPLLARGKGGGCPMGGLGTVERPAKRPCLGPGIQPGPFGPRNHQDREHMGLQRSRRWLAIVPAPRTE